jgi:hypothetical protein
MFVIRIKCHASLVVIFEAVTRLIDKNRPKAASLGLKGGATHIWDSNRLIQKSA